MDLVILTRFGLTVVLYHLIIMKDTSLRAGAATTFAEYFKRCKYGFFGKGYNVPMGSRSFLNILPLMAIQRGTQQDSDLERMFFICKQFLNDYLCFFISLDVFRRGNRLESSGILRNLFTHYLRYSGGIRQNTISMTEIIFLLMARQKKPDQLAG